MRHHSYNPNFNFIQSPVEFNKYTDRDTLQYCLGATLYMPGTKDIKEKGTKDIKEKVLHHQLDVTSLVMCCEDAIKEEDLPVAEQNILNHMDFFADKIAAGELTHDDIPLIFVRVRNPEQFEHFASRMTVKQASVLTGFNFPKFSSKNALRVLQTLVNVNNRLGVVLYGMPILEGPEVAFHELRGQELLLLRWRRTRSGDRESADLIRLPLYAFAAFGGTVVEKDRAGAGPPFSGVELELVRRAVSVLRFCDGKQRAVFPIEHAFLQIAVFRERLKAELQPLRIVPPREDPRDRRFFAVGEIARRFAEIYADIRDILVQSAVVCPKVFQNLQIDPAKIAVIRLIFGLALRVDDGVSDLHRPGFQQRIARVERQDHPVFQIGRSGGFSVQKDGQHGGLDSIDVAAGFSRQHESLCSRAVNQAQRKGLVVFGGLRFRFAAPAGRAGEQERENTNNGNYSFHHYQNLPFRLFILLDAQESSSVAFFESILFF